MYFDLMYQTTITHIMFCHDNEAKRVVRYVYNEGARKKETKYWVVFGRYIDKATEEKKESACARVLNPKWIQELISTTNSTENNTLQTFFDNVKNKDINAIICESQLKLMNDNTKQ